ncbi:MAG: NUDIX hydrolase [Anaerolineae bacterium]|nr:NUDIX hydrolase [Anaerolineae bacterium]
MVEMLDIYDENLTPLGVKERSAVHRDGDWHRTFHCWVIYRSTDGVDYMVVQKRGPDKDLFPNMLDVSAAGHYEAGESTADGVREIREELGLDVDFDDLIPVGIRVSVARQFGLVDYEFNDVFFLICDQPLNAYHFQKEEISGLVRFAIDDGLALFDETCESITGETIGLGSAQIAIHKTNFILQPDNYLYRVLALAKRCLNGDTRLLI